MHLIDSATLSKEPTMNTFQPQRRQARSRRAFVVAAVIVVNAGIARFIDQFAGAATAEMAIAKLAAGAVRG